VLRLLEENLAATPQALGDARRECPEELAERYARVLAATCGAAAALARLAADAASPADAELAAGVRALLAAPAFTRGALGSKVAAVRRAGYDAVAAVARAAPALLDAAALAAPVAGAVGERDAASHAAMWGALLSFFRAAPDAWARVNLQKAFFPRLWALLRHGCHGSAQASFPALLPLLALLPAEALGAPLFEAALRAMWEGLASQPAGADRDAAAAALQECLLFALQRGPGAGAGNAARAVWEEVLRVALPGTVVPAAAGGGELAPAARGVLVGAAGRLAEQRDAPAWRLDALLRLVGDGAASAVRVELAAEAPAAAPFDAAAALATELLASAGSAAARVGEFVARPLAAAVLPAVRAGGAPAAASSLLAALLAAFPDEAAGAAGDAGASSAPAALAALRLHESASFTMASVLAQLENARGDAAQLAASCDLLAALLPQAADPAGELADALRRVLAGCGAAAAAALVDRVCSSSALPLPNWRSAALDALVAELCGDAEALAADAARARLAACLLSCRLLTAAGEAAALRALAEQLHEGGGDAAHAAALSVGAGALAAGVEEGPDAAAARLDLLSAAFEVMACEAAASAALDAELAGSDAESDAGAEPGKLQAAALAAWRAAAPAELLLRANEARRGEFAGSLLQAVDDALSTAPPAAAAAAVAACARLALAACAGDPALERRVLRGLHGGGARPVFSLRVGEAAGFGPLLAAFAPDDAALAIALLGADLPPAAGAALLRHVAGDAALLRRALPAALGADGAALGRLLRAAVAAPGGVAEVAEFVRASLGGADPGAVAAALAVAAGPLREGAPLLLRSRLPALALDLCERAAAADGAAAEPLLAAVAAAFPCRRVAPPAAGAAPGAPAPAVHARGAAVWYRDAQGAWLATTVASVDLSVDPPSYDVALPGGLRETEGARLVARREGAPPPPARAPAAHSMADHGFECGHAEREALLRLLRARAAAAPTSAGGAVAVAAAGYAWRLFANDDWGLVLDGALAALDAAAAAAAAAAAGVAAAAADAAAAVAGAPFECRALALQFFARLGHKGLLAGTGRAAAEAARVGGAAAAGAAAVAAHAGGALAPALQALWQVWAAAPAVRTLPAVRWEEAQAAACAAALAAFASCGALAAAVDAVGQGAAAAPLLAPAAAAAWEDLGALTLYALRTGDEAFLRGAVARADAAAGAAGSDCIDALLALALGAAAPPPLAAAAFEAFLLHPALARALSAAAAAAEDADALEQAAAGGGDDDDAALLERAGVRPELAAALAAPGRPAHLAAWALLAAHLLQLPPDSAGRRLLVQVLKEARGLVPGAFDALVPLLPLPAAPRGSPGPAAPPSPGAGAPPDGAEPGSAAAMLAAGAPAAWAGDAAAERAFAAELYAALLRALPVPARLWFGDLRDRAAAAALEGYTAAAVSPRLLAAEYAAADALAAGGDRFDKFTVRAAPGSREIVARLEVEDGHALELAVRLPAALPLRPPEAVCRRSIGVAEARMGRWMLSIAAFLRNANGPAAGAVRQWKRNVEREFEGQEECLICVSIVHPSTGQLPRLACRTCRKRFHGACLYKWFASSGKSTCVHCQAPW
jgi:hypothetical protein